MGMSMRWSVRYERGHLSGYTDDLGIIADRNQWVMQVLPGWYARVDLGVPHAWHEPYRAYDEAEDWCRTNLRNWMGVRNNLEIHIGSKDEAALFELVWG